jgi:hypothetical protein
MNRPQRRSSEHEISIEICHGIKRIIKFIHINLIWSTIYAKLDDRITQ